jgi:hypothetical protein
MGLGQICGTGKFTNKKIPERISIISCPVERFGGHEMIDTISAVIGIPCRQRGKLFIGLGVFLILEITHGAIETPRRIVKITLSVSQSKSKDYK